MGHQASDEGQRVVVDRERAAPILSRRMLVGDEVVGMVERHEHDDQSAQRVEREQARGLVFHVLNGYILACFRHRSILRMIVSEGECHPMRSAFARGADGEGQGAGKGSMPSATPTIDSMP